MYIKNKTNGNITLAEVLNGNDLVIPANGQTNDFVPNKKVLNKALAFADRLEFYVTSATQLDMVNQLDPRYDTLLKIE